MSDTVTLEQQIACAKRELALRKRMYPTWVTAKRLNPIKAAEEIAAMQAIITTLEGIKAKGTR